MDLPVDEWKSYLLQKWASLPKSIQLTISTAETLSDIFLHSSSLLQPEDELFLKRLSKGYLVGKDSDAPLFYREQGNKKFQEKDYTGAAVLYSKGVSHSRPNTEDMSLCYANRSAALFHLGQYETCLKDISRAQTHGYPERLQPKIMLRKAECLVALGRLQEASQTVGDLERNFTATPTLADVPRQTLQRNLHHLKTKLQEKESPTETFPATLAKTLEDVALRGENERLSNASSSVGLCIDPLKGRYLVATEDILPGELLVKEDAFVSVLNPGELPPPHHGLDSQWDTSVTNGDLYCHRCLKHTLATVPCDGCSYAKYCSQECLQQAWELYHRTECPLGGLLLTLGVFCHIALRLTLVVGVEDVRKIVKKLCVKISNKDICLPESDNQVKTLNYGRGESEKNGNMVETPIPGCDANGKYDSNYDAVFNLLPHTENHSPEHKFLCALCVSVLCRQLEAAGLQAIPTGVNSSQLTAAVTPELCPDVTIWGVAMLRHMLQLQCNAQAITTIQHTGKRETDAQAMTTVQHTGPHKSRMGVAERQQKLRSQYFFDCTCPACQTEAHRMAAGPRWKAFCCNSCRAPMQGDGVLRCGNRSCAESAVSRDHLVSRLQDLQQQVGVAQKLLRDGELERAVQLLSGCQRDAESFLWAEHAMVGEIADGLARACAALGDWQKSATHLQKSLRVAEVRHGPSSVEMGHELFKLAQIFFNGFAVPEALSTIQKAEEVLSLHCGPWDDEIQELRKMKSCLLDLPPTL
ncbi:PREDICTED: SET and MYND domain-containing protein 4 [Mandrillus leucophaeus]|uniref:SET and MYND domain-containing protein 4 n=1 Tax=Mandrillus leucophaeus TaxID=9568 RepID=UPI0005F4D7B9|nr:PREDICTED: SET and MYND domain-containing protein 4 [Mandrillus leucophaeus]